MAIKLIKVLNDAPSLEPTRRECKHNRPYMANYLIIEKLSATFKIS
jgi:hypothetical protein